MEAAERSAQAVWGQALPLVLPRRGMLGGHPDEGRARLRAAPSPSCKRHVSQNLLQTQNQACETWRAATPR